jgi:aspartyl-tRNA(Asn)/glutamyl-tRNA(Gln) amidotransferase subunit B
MLSWAVWAVFFSGIFSAIIGVAATICYNSWAERRRLRFECFRQLMRHGPGNPEFLKAFNEVPAVFGGRRRVQGAHLAMLDKSTATNTFHGRDELVNLIDRGKISGKQAKVVFAEMFASGKSAALIVKEKGIEQLSDASAIEALCDQVIADNPKPVADFKAGNVASLNFLKGQVIKLSKGKANPQLVGEILEQKLMS